MQMQMQMQIAKHWIKELVVREGLEGINTLKLTAWDDNTGFEVTVFGSGELNEDGSSKDAGHQSFGLTWNQFDSLVEAVEALRADEFRAVAAGSAGQAP